MSVITSVIRIRELLGGTVAVGSIRNKGAADGMVASGNEEAVGAMGATGASGGTARHMALQVLLCFQVTRKDAKGQTMQGCNDCTFDYEGNLWVTAPAGEIAPHTYVRSFSVITF